MRTLTTLLTCLILTACGGGSSSSSGTTPALPAAPTTSSSAITLSNATIDIAGVGGDFLIQAASGVSVTVSGNSNRVEFSANQASSSISITGVSNTIIIRPGCSAAYLSVTGTGNTFWIPNTMTFILDNPSPPAVTLIRYTP